MCEKVKLWKNGTPLFNKEYGQDEPYLVSYVLENGKNDNPCVIVLPGGGYSGLATDHEGKQICELLNSNGYSAFYLIYRVAPYKHPCMEYDAKRAVRLVRFRAKEYGIAPDKIGIMGFSAGGHLTCMAGLRFDYGIDGGDEIDKVSSRPDNVAPCYAVASLDADITHWGTRNNLLGEDASDALAAEFSSENIVPEDAPPFFMFHTAADNAVAPECSLRLAKALIDKKIPCSLHIFPYGAHGIGLGSDIPLTRDWSSLYIKWLNDVNKISEN